MIWRTATVLAAVTCVGVSVACGDDVSLKIATFECDVTPPIGSALCEGAVAPVRRVDDPLSCRGIVLLGDSQPIVLCAVDWVGIANQGHDAWRAALAEAASTRSDRVAVHCLHQHDAPVYDLSAEALMKERGLPGRGFDPAFGKEAIARAARALATGLGQPKTVTHLGVGKAKVTDVASNRRVLGADGKVRYVRWSKTADPRVRAAPEGIIDPCARVISFWNGDKPVAILSYYATHPQSYYGQGSVSCDFVGIARRICAEIEPGAFWVHFNGASGNVTAGKYNDGSHENRPALARRLADGMAAALKDSAAHKTPISAGELGWRTVPVGLPPAQWLDESALAKTFTEKPTFALARKLVWPRLRREGRTIDLAVLKLGPAHRAHARRAVR